MLLEPITESKKADLQKHLSYSSSSFDLSSSLSLPSSLEFSRNSMSRPPYLNPSGAGYSNIDRHDPQSPQYAVHPQHQQQQPPNPFYDGRHSPRERYDSGSSGEQHETAQGVMNGQIGAGYGPYAYNGPQQGGGATPLSPSMQSLQNRYSARNSNLPSPFANLNQPPSSSGHSGQATPRMSSRNMAATAAAGASAPLVAGPTRHAPVFTARDAELDDKLHNPSPSDKYDDQVSCTAFSLRGWLNVAGILFLVAGLIVLFAGYPIIQWAQSHAAKTYGAYNIGGINATGQVPNIPGLPSLIDKDTPEDRLTRTGFDGEKYVLVFSDEVSLRVPFLSTVFIGKLNSLLFPISSTRREERSGPEMIHSGKLLM